jgi:hypothetical protein
MKVAIKDTTGELVFFQKIADDSSKTGKLISHLMALPKGDKVTVELETNGHPLTFTTVELDVSVIVKLANGIIVKNADSAIIAPTAPVAPTV